MKYANIDEVIQRLKTVDERTSIHCERCVDIIPHDEQKYGVVKLMHGVY
jgi:hypothetical protein